MVDVYEPLGRTHGSTLLPDVSIHLKVGSKIGEKIPSLHESVMLFGHF